MVARIKGFVTRAEAGLVKPKSVSRNIHPGRGGSAKHYYGSGGHPKSHAECIARWRSVQRDHMAKGWVDLAYTGGYCDHGFAFAGRGFGIRTAANGTNDSNDRFYAFMYLGGAKSTPTRDALDALDWWFSEARRVGGAGSAEANHSDFKPTGCPGDFLRKYNPNTSPVVKPPAVKPTVKAPYVPGPKHKFPLPTGKYYFGKDDGSKYSVSGKHKRLFRKYYDQWWIREFGRQLARRGWNVNKYLAPYGNDGIFGDKYDGLVRAFQREQGLQVDGKLGIGTWTEAFHRPIS